MGNLSSAFEKADTSAAYLYGEINLIPALGIRFRIANCCTWWRGIFTRISQDGGLDLLPIAAQDGGRGDFSENLRTSLFNKCLHV